MSQVKCMCVSDTILAHSGVFDLHLRDMLTVQHPGVVLCFRPSMGCQGFSDRPVILQHGRPDIGHNTVQGNADGYGLVVTDSTGAVLGLFGQGSSGR